MKRYNNMARKKKTDYSSTAELAAYMQGVRKDITEATERYKQASDMLLTMLKVNNKKREGIFTIATRQTLKIVNESQALAWAREKSVFKIDTAKAMRVIRRQLEMPEGFKIEQTEYISTAGSKETE